MIHAWHRSHPLIVAVMSAALFGLPVFAAQQHDAALSVDPALTLAEVAGRTLERYPDQRLIDARYQQAEALGLQSSAFLAGNPTVVLSHHTDQVGSGRGQREWEAGVELPLWWPGQKTAQQDVAERTNGAVDASRIALGLRVAGAVRESLWDIALQRNSLAVAEHEREVAESLARNVRRRFELGDLARTDVLLAQDEALRKQAAVVRARAEAKHAEVAYRLLTGLGAMPADFEEVPIETEIVGLDHPALAEAVAGVEEAQARLRLARERTADNPQLMVGSRHERDASGAPYANSFGLAVRLPIGTSAQTAVRRADAGVNLAEALSRRDTLKRELEKALHEAVHNLTTTREELALATAQNALAQENLQLARTAFAAGEIDLMDLLRVQSTAFAAQRTEKQRALELTRAVARVNQTAGVLP
jgi:cobalt-zinc-cadmium efflux system outer membrane protein